MRIRLTQFSSMQVALDMSNYAFIRTYVAKAESALESAQASASNNAKKSAAPVNLPGMVAPAQDPIEAAKERERKIVQERLLVASGVAHLGSGAYDRAAYSFTDVGTEALSSGTSHVSRFFPSNERSGCRTRGLNSRILLAVHSARRRRLVCYRDRSRMLLALEAPYPHSRKPEFEAFLGP